MEHEIIWELRRRGADIVRFVDITALPPAQTGGHPLAVLICMPLSREFILDLHQGRPTKSDEYLEKEKAVEDLADWLEEWLARKGYAACSQSEANNLRRGLGEGGFIAPEIEAGVSALPVKTIARLAGMGFVGKNNLLVTEQYGCALCMSSVLANIPVKSQNFTQCKPRCNACSRCIEACEPRALSGRGWDMAGERETLLDKAKCCCALRCMVACPWTMRYAKSPVE